MHCHSRLRGRVNGLRGRSVAAIERAPCARGVVDHVHKARFSDPDRPLRARHCTRRTDGSGSAVTRLRCRLAAQSGLRSARAPVATRAAKPCPVGRRGRCHKSRCMIIAGAGARTRSAAAAFAAAALAFCGIDRAYAQTDTAPPPAQAATNTAATAASQPRFAIYGQATYTEQETDGFPCSVRRSEQPVAGHRRARPRTRPSYLGARLWRGAELWVNPEADQGFGLDNTLGLAGFSSGEAYKVGRNPPYFRLPRAFIRQTLNLGGAVRDVDAGPNQFALPQVGRPSWSSHWARSVSSTSSIPTATRTTREATSSTGPSSTRGPSTTRLTRGDTRWAGPPSGT